MIIPQTAFMYMQINLSTFYFIRKLISFAVPLSTFYFTLKSEITLSVWQNIVHACFENIGYLIDFEE